MHVHHWGKLFAFASLIVGSLACDASGAVNALIAENTATPTRTPRPTYTSVPVATDTPIPTKTSAPSPSPTMALTQVPPTVKPPTARPANTVAPKATTPPQPPVSTYEFHVNPPTCVHSGKTFIKGTVYNNKNDPSQRYAGAIVALGAPDGGTIYVDPIKTDYNGEYTFILNDQGSRPGTWGLWLVDPSHRRKSDIGVITTNDLGPDNPNTCWAGTVDFWK